jgi:hypothetical protein
MQVYFDQHLTGTTGIGAQKNSYHPLALDFGRLAISYNIGAD